MQGHEGGRERWWESKRAGGQENERVRGWEGNMGESAGRWQGGRARGWEGRRMRGHKGGRAQGWEDKQVRGLEGGRVRRCPMSLLVKLSLPDIAFAPLCCPIYKV